MYIYEYIYVYRFLYEEETVYVPFNVPHFLVILGNPKPHPSLHSAIMWFNNGRHQDLRGILELCIYYMYRYICTYRYIGVHTMALGLIGQCVYMGPSWF